MRTRKTFIHEDGIYEGVSRLPEPREKQLNENVPINYSYDGYPERQPSIKGETEKFEEIIDLPLGEEYKLQSQIDNYSKTNNQDVNSMATLYEELNNIEVKLGFS
jgi:hypothetical protein